MEREKGRAVDLSARPLFFWDTREDRCECLALTVHQLAQYANFIAA